MSDRPSTAALVARYADGFHAALVDGSHTVTSPLGAWLLLALVAPAATGETRARLEAVLGTDVDDALARATALLAEPHPAVAAAAAVWARRERMQAAFDAWTGRIAGAVTVGGVPTQAEADAWATEHTLGLIPHFPVALDDDTIVVLANALATKVRWRAPFRRVPSPALGGPWAERVTTVLDAPGEHRVRIVHTEAAGDVAVHAARSGDDLLVLSVIGASDLAPTRVLAAAQECVPVARRKWRPGRGGSAVSLFDLPLGDGPAWTIRETSVIDPDERETFRACLPAWTVRADHDLVARAVDGMVDGLGALLGMVSPEWPPEGAARQVAVATYGAEGFEAAAISTMEARFTGMPRGTPEPVRLAEVRFAHPYAVVAVAVGGDPPWDGVPVFTAWVAEPTEA